MWSILKSSFMGAAGIVVRLFWEAFKAMFFRMAWTTVVERFVSRVVIAGLKWIAKVSTNDVVDETVTDIIASLQGKNLRVFDAQQVKPVKKSKV